MRLRGVVDSFSAKNGFGFIRLSSGKVAHVHYSALETGGYPALEQGTEVECDVEPGPMGLRALNVCHCLSPKGEE